MSLPVYNCLIVDDEPLARDVLKRYIQKLPMLNLAGECGNALQVIPFLHSHPIDLLFLDIQMPQLTGLELVSALTNPPKIIFTTAFGEYALQSYDLEAADYLLKPIKFDRFIKAVNKALPVVAPISMSIPIAATPTTMMADSDTFLYFRADRKMVKVKLNTILYIESLKDYVKIITETDQVITKYSMAALEAMLPPSGFIRIHRSYIINMQKLKSYTASHVQISSKELPIGKLYQREALKLLNN
jgi:DNA-binding LytR/AlgR family response regulator